jgi:hypothetical protein
MTNIARISSVLREGKSPSARLRVSSAAGTRGSRGCTPKTTWRTFKSDDRRTHPHEGTKIRGRSSLAGHPLDAVRQPVVPTCPVQRGHRYQMMGQVLRQPHFFQFPFPICRRDVRVRNLTVQRVGIFPGDAVHILRPRTGKFVDPAQVWGRVGEDGGDYASDIRRGNRIGLAAAERQFDAAFFADARTSAWKGTHSDEGYQTKNARNESLSRWVRYNDEGFGGRYLRQEVVCIARHLRQSFKGERIRVEYAESLHAQFGELLAPMAETPQMAPHGWGHRRLVKCEKEESLPGTGFVLGP